jgi:hypothetical protein
VRFYHYSSLHVSEKSQIPEDWTVCSFASDRAAISFEHGRSVMKLTHLYTTKFLSTFRCNHNLPKLRAQASFNISATRNSPTAAHNFFQYFCYHNFSHNRIQTSFNISITITSPTTAHRQVYKGIPQLHSSVSIINAPNSTWRLNRTQGF